MLARLCCRFPWLTPVIATHERVAAVGGGPLASSIALAGFLSLFPLMLVGVAVLGFVSARDVNFAAHVVDQLGLEGKAADTVIDTIDIAEESRRAASVVGLVGVAWGGLAIAGALETALNAIWQVKGRGLSARLVGAAWLAGGGLLFLASVALGAVLNELPGPAAVPTVLVGLLLDVVLFVWMFATLTNVRVSWRAHLPGALVGGVGLEVLKLVGTVYVPRAVASSSALYGSLGVVFALLAWLALASRLVVYAAAFNVVLYERRHGTVTVGVEVPRFDREVPLAANRGGAVAQSGTDPSADRPARGSRA